MLFSHSLGKWLLLLFRLVKWPFLLYRLVKGLLSHRLVKGVLDVTQAGEMAVVSTQFGVKWLL